MQKLKLSGSMLVFLGAAFWSLNSPLVKFLTLDSYLICGLRSAIAAVALAAFIRPKQLKWNGWMLLYVCSYAALSLSVISALTMTSAPIAVGMQYTATVWLFLINLIATRKFNLRAFIPVCVILVGVALFMCSFTDATSAQGNLIALSEGIFFTGLTLGAKKAAGTNSVGLTGIANAFTAVVVFLLFPQAGASISTLTGRDWLIMLILGVVQVSGGYVCYTLGVQRTTPQKASIIALWEMILGPVWVALFLKEYPSALVLVGFAIVLAGIVLDSRMNTD